MHFQSPFGILQNVNSDFISKNSLTRIIHLQSAHGSKNRQPLISRYQEVFFFFCSAHCNSVFISMVMQFNTVKVHSYYVYSIAMNCLAALHLLHSECSVTALQHRNKLNSFAEQKTERNQYISAVQYIGNAMQC